jgi:2-C-methyl-D-erythritol 4-phosphate cytidylyltransferase
VSVSAILAAAGRGDRLGQPKQLLDLGGRPVVAWSLELFEHTPEIGAIYIACEDEQRARFEQIAKHFAPSKTRNIVAGGTTRQASVFAALSSIAPAPDLVLVHDGARPFVSREIVARTIAAARRSGAAIAAVPVKDTIKVAGSENLIERTLERDRLWAAQTPQVFRYDLLVAAHAKASADAASATDDAALVERLGVPVELVMGSYENIKITTPDDLETARHVALHLSGALR